MTLRTLVNVPGVDFDPAKTDVLFAEDYNAVADELSTQAEAIAELEARPAGGVFAITTSAGDNGVVDPLGINFVVSGSDKTIEIVPDSGYVLDGVIVDGVDVLPAPSEYVFSDIQSNHTLEATFGQLVATGFGDDDFNGVYVDQLSPINGHASYLNENGKSLEWDAGESWVLKPSPDFPGHSFAYYTAGPDVPIPFGQVWNASGADAPGGSIDIV